MIARWLIMVVLALSGWESSRAAGRADDPRKDGTGAVMPAFQTDVQPVFSQYCYNCHGVKKKGDLDLRIYSTDVLAKKDPQVFEKIFDHLKDHEMPPENKPQPTDTERERITAWIETEVLGCDCNHPDPGRVTIRRLNRAEYNNTIRDLVGVNFQPAEDFPMDDVGYGFDNIGDVLSLSPMLMEKYLAAAGKIMDLAIVTEPSKTERVTKFDAAHLESTAPGGLYNDSARMLASEGEVYAKFQFPATNEYVLRVRAFGQQAGPEPARLEFRVDGRPIKVVDVAAVEAHPQVYEVRAQVTPGEKRVSAAFINDYYQPNDPDPNNRDRNLIIDYLEIVEPAGPRPLPESHQRIFIRQPTPRTINEDAREIIQHFARRAYRRPLTRGEMERLLRIFQMVEKDGGNFESGIKVALEAVLVSPNFLFRGELQADPDNPQSVHPVGEYALASRLSYFLWSTMPDDELFALAAKGKLRANLDRQVRRMLTDPKAHALVRNFADQWLQIRNLAAVTPDKETFPSFDEDLRSAMATETERFFEYIMQQDRSVLEFIGADYTFLNERLARHYGIKGVTGKDFQLVHLQNGERGGLLTQASILTITSTPTRTSPVKRGKWVLENVLGAPPPPPPPNVPTLKEGKEAALTGTMRQRMEKHRADPACASCHARMDPIGFGFENFDAIGAWRAKEGEFTIDPSGKLYTGESFNGAADLRTLMLKDKRDQFVRCLSEKMLTYALGRGLEHYDKCAVDQIVKDLARDQYKFSSLILDIVHSIPFQMRRGETQKMEQASLSSK